MEKSHQQSQAAAPSGTKLRCPCLGYEVIKRVYGKEHGLTHVVCKPLHGRCCLHLRTPFLTIPFLNDSSPFFRVPSVPFNPPLSTAVDTSPSAHRPNLPQDPVYHPWLIRVNVNPTSSLGLNVNVVLQFLLLFIARLWCCKPLA